MKRNQRLWAFWILVFSLNLVPLVAQGKQPHAAPAKKGAVASKRAKKAATKKAAAKPAKKAAANKTMPVAAAPNAPVELESNAQTPADIAPPQALTNEQAPSEALKASIEIRPEQKAATQDASAPAARKARTMSLSDINSVIPNFMPQERGQNPDKAVALLGRVFNDCLRDSEGKSMLEIANTSQNRDVVCVKQPEAGAFSFTDKGGFAACMAKHKEHGDECTDETCTYLSTLPGAILPLAGLGDGKVQIVSINPNGNELNRYNCEDLVDAKGEAIQHLTAATILKKDGDERKQKQYNALDLALDQVAHCRHDAEEISLAREACAQLVVFANYPGLQSHRSFTKYRSVDDCVRANRLPEEALRLLAKDAKTKPVEDLSTVRDQLLDWARENNSQCAKIVDPLQDILRRQANRRIPRSRDGDVNPLEGYDEAISTVEQAMADLSCLRDNTKLSQMRDNLTFNRLDRAAEINGSNNQEFRDQYADLRSELIENVFSECFSWEMNPSCNTALQGLQSMETIWMDAQMADQRIAQGLMAKQEMLQRMGQGGAGSMSQLGGGSGFGRIGFGGAGGMGSSGYNGLSLTNPSMSSGYIPSTASFGFSGGGNLSLMSPSMGSMGGLGQFSNLGYGGARGF